MTEIPKKGGGREAIWGNLFRQCTKVGMSFFVPFSRKTMEEFGSTVHAWNKRLEPMHFVIRSKDVNGKREAKDGKEGFRVWRDR